MGFSERLDWRGRQGEGAFELAFVGLRVTSRVETCRGF